MSIEAVPEVAVNTKKYTFTYYTHCNMCGAGEESRALLGRRLDRRQGLWPRRRPGIAISIFRCRECGLVFPDPMPTPESIGQHYDVAPEEYWTPEFFAEDPDYLRHQIETYARVSGSRPSGRALDVGSGLGKAILALDRAGFETEGIEPSATFRQAAIDRMGIREDRLKLSSVEDAAYPDDSFDFINFSAVLEHLADPAAAVAKMVGWLTPGGLLHIEVPSSDYLISNLMRLFYRMTGSDYVINTAPMHMPYHLYEFGTESFVRHGRRAGYEIAFREFLPCASYMPRILIGPFNAVMRATNTGMQLVVWLRKAG